MSATYTEVETAPNHLPTDLLQDAAETLFDEMDHARIEDMQLFEDASGTLYATTLDADAFVCLDVSANGLSAEPVDTEDIDMDELEGLGIARGGD